MGSMDIHQFVVLWTLTTLSLTILWNTAESFNLDERFPIIFEDPKNHSGRESYFGHSIIMYVGTGKDADAWMIVGAPRANSSFEQHHEIREPGQVYKCNLSPPRKCEPVLLDGTGNECELSDNNICISKDYKDGAWIGASMAAQTSPDGRVVICGPRWIDQKDIEKGNIYQLGICYWKHIEDKEYVKLNPLELIEDERQHNQAYGKDDIKYRTAFGEGGFSINIPLKQEKSKIILGVPGFSNWKGGVVLCQDKSSTRSERKRSVKHTDFSKRSNPIDVNPTTLSDFGYLGYQVSSGYIMDPNELLYVASAPRAENLKGMVVIFKLKEEKGNEIDPAVEIKVTHKGRQIGEYFGASLAVGDLNNDGFDDLIVGAPLYTKEDSGSIMGNDEGRISVIFGRNGTFLSNDDKVTGYKRGARFGSAVSYLGNLDSDSFAEIGVGAPYEDEGRGVVYILSRGERGHWDKIVQRLTARDIYPNLRGFGASITVHLADIDGNGCDDIAVGAYKSGHVAIFRGQPVVKWKLNPVLLHKHIPHNINSLSLMQACIHYQGRNVPQNLEVKFMVEMDPIYQRFHINTERVHSTVIDLKKNQKHCETINITSMPEIKDITNPVEVKMTCLLTEKHKTLKNDNRKYPILITRDGIEGEGPDYFCKTCPISQNPPSLSIEIPFEVECGDDNICETDLKIVGLLPHLSYSGEKIEFTVGLNKTLIFKVYVYNKNKSESAYRTRVCITLKSPVTISRIPRECNHISSIITPDGCNLGSKEFILNQTSSTSSFYIQCKREKPLSTSSYWKLDIELDMTDLYGSKGIDLSASTTTASKEMNKSDNSWYMHLPLRYEADIAIAGKSEMELYNFNNKNEAGSKINVIHTYEVQKFGHSPVEKVDIEFYIPFAIENNKEGPVSFITLKSLQGKQDGQPIPCDSKIELDLSAKSSFYNELITSEQSKARRKTSLNIFNSTGSNNLTNSTDNQVPSNRTLYLNCSSLSKDVYPRILCRKAICTTRPFHNSFVVARVQLTMELDTQPLKKAKNEKDIILFETLGTVRVIEPIDLHQPGPERSKPDWASTSTLFIGDIPAKQVASWLIALAVIAGIVVLALLGLALYKAGFFERKKKAELDDLKSQMVSDTANEETIAESQENIIQ